MTCCEYYIFLSRSYEKECVPFKKLKRRGWDCRFRADPRRRVPAAPWKEREQPLSMETNACRQSLKHGNLGCASLRAN